MSLVPWYRRPSLPERLLGTPDINDVFGSVFRGFPALTRSTDGDGAWLPTIDVKEDDKQVTLLAELPGVKREDIKLDVSGNTLTLRGEKKDEKAESSGTWWHREACHGSFLRQITLPAEVDGERASAKMEDGILKVALPKVAAAKAKTISVS